MLTALQITDHQTTLRGESDNVTPGSWNDLCLVLTGRNLPEVYRHGPRHAASVFLRDLRGTSAVFNKLGLYMLQCTALSWDLV